MFIASGTAVGHIRAIEKLKRVLQVDDRIPVYVEKPENFETRRDELIAAGAIVEADRARCVYWLQYRHYSKWQADDEASRRLDAQAAIRTPCATWLAAPQAPADDDRTTPE